MNFRHKITQISPYRQFCRIVNGIKNKKHKKQPWGKVDPRCPKDKNHSPFHGEKPLMIK